MNNSGNKQMARLPSRETISSISHKFGIRYGHAREQTSCGSSSTRWSRVVREWRAQIASPPSQSNTFPFSLQTRRNQSKTNSRIAFKLGEYSNGPLLSCTNFIMIAFIGNMPSFVILINDPLNRNMHVIYAIYVYFRIKNKTRSI